MRSKPGFKRQHGERRDRSLLEVLAQGAEDEAGDALEELDHHVADEPVAHDDIGAVLDQVVRLDVANEMEVERRQLGVGLAGQLVALLNLLADVEEADPRVRHVEDVLGEDRAHRSELDQVLRIRVDVGAHVEQHHRTGGGHHVGRQGRSVDALDAAETEDGGGHGRPRRAGADDGVGRTVTHEVGGDHDRRSPLRADGGGRVIPHLDDLGGVDELDVGRDALAVRGGLALQARDVTHEADLVGAVECVLDGAANDLARGVVATHRVDRDAHLA